VVPPSAAPPEEPADELAPDPELDAKPELDADPELDVEPEPEPLAELDPDPELEPLLAEPLEPPLPPPPASSATLLLPESVPQPAIAPPAVRTMQSDPPSSVLTMWLASSNHYRAEDNLKPTPRLPRRANM
jgi:hypothetical protein